MTSKDIRLDGTAHTRAATPVRRASAVEGVRGRGGYGARGSASLATRRCDSRRASAESVRSRGEVYGGAVVAPICEAHFEWRIAAYHPAIFSAKGFLGYGRTIFSATRLYAKVLRAHSM